MAHKLVAYWNTGNGYTAKGQRITAALTEDNRIIFCDHDRGIPGVIAINYAVQSFDPNTNKQQLIAHVHHHYLNGFNYIYDQTGDADKLEVCSSDPTHGGKPGKPGQTVESKKQDFSYQVWTLTDTRKFSRTWEAVTPKLTEVQAQTIKAIYSEAYPNKEYAVSVNEPS